MRVPPTLDASDDEAQQVDIDFVQLAEPIEQRDKEPSHKRGMPLWPMGITKNLPVFSESVYIPPELLLPPSVSDSARLFPLPGINRLPF